METFQRRRSKITSFTGDVLASTKPAFRDGNRQAREQRNFPKLASDSSSCSSDTTDNDELMFELGWGSSKQVVGTPVKKLLAEEMSRETESKRRTPSVIARLMGLDGLPPQQPSHKQHKRSMENHQQRAASVERAERNCSSSGRRSFRKSSKEEQEFKDVYEVSDASKVESSRKPLHGSHGTSHLKFSEADMVFIRQKFMDAKRLSTDERLQDSKEFHDALEVLDSNKDLLLKFLQQPDPLFTKHLHDLQFSPPQSHCGRMSAMKTSHARKYESSVLGGNAERETPGKNHCKSPPKHHNSLPNYSYSRHSAQSLHKSTKNQLKGKDAAAPVPTRIVVLKPNLGMTQSAIGTVSSPQSSHANLSDCRKQTELVGIKNREAESWGKKNIPDDVGSSRHKSRQSREIAQEITRKMRNSFGSGSRNFSSSGCKGYAGDESSGNMTGSESANESVVKTVISRDDFDRHYRFRSSSSRSTESSVSREAKKRLSERWKMTHRSQELGVISRGSTLGEMLAIPDSEVKSAISDAVIGEDGFSNKLVSNDGPARWVEPLGISSRDGWKNGRATNLARSRSLPASSSFGSPKANKRRETLCDDRYMMPKETIKRERNKVVKGNCDHREGSSSRSSRSSSRKSSRRTSRESNDTSPDIHLTLHQVDSTFKEDAPSEDSFIVSEASTSMVTDTNPVPENLVSEGHESTTISSESPSPELSAPLLVNDDASTGDLDISSSKEPSDGPAKEVPSHHPVSELESTASSKETDQPSPSSTLEAPFTDDLSCGSDCFESLSADLNGLRMQLQLLKLESESHTEGPMLVSSDEDAEERSVGFIGEESILQDEDNWESSYVADIFIESGFNNVNPDTFIATCHSPECPVSPLVFEEVEKKYCNLILLSRSERKLMFDNVNEKLMEIHQQYTDQRPWVKLGKVKPKWDKNELWDCLQKLVTSQCNRTSEDTSEMVPLVSESQWLDIGDDIDVIGRETEKLLIDELVAELVAM